MLHGVFAGALPSAVLAKAEAQRGRQTGFLEGQKWGGIYHEVAARAVGEAAILLHPPLPLVGVSIQTMGEYQQGGFLNNTSGPADAHGEAERCAQGKIFS